MMNHLIVNIDPFRAVLLKMLFILRRSLMLIEYYCNQNMNTAEGHLKMLIM
jgi:hypothetical protein